MRMTPVCTDGTTTLRQAWQFALADAPAGSHIATLPELAHARIETFRRHAPGKPWKHIRDGSTPIWQSSLATSTALLLGRIRGTLHLVAVHGFAMPPDPLGGLEEWRRRIRAEDGFQFHLSEKAWRAAAASAPASQRLAYGNKDYPTFNPLHEKALDEAACRHHPLFAALFGDALEDYVAAHRQIAHEYVLEDMPSDGLMDQEYRAFADRPPLLRIDISWPGSLSANWDIPTSGAIGKYACLESIYAENFRVGDSDVWSVLTSILTCGPHDKVGAALVTP